MRVYHGHMIGLSDEVDPVTKRPLYGISELKKPLEPPLLFSQSACMEYIRKVDPYDKSTRNNTMIFGHNNTAQTLRRLDREDAIIRGDYDET